MSEIFISYAKGDRPTAAALAKVLEARGWSVWWDREIPPGRTFDDVIEAALTQARCVIVLWSVESAASRWVRTECSVAAERGILVPALIEEAPIPLEFRRLQAARLIGWSGDRDDDELERLIERCAGLLATTRSPADIESTRGKAPRRRSVMPWLLSAGFLATFVAGAVIVHLFQRDDAAGTPAPQSAQSASTKADTTVPARATDTQVAAASGVKNSAAAAGTPSVAATVPGRINLLSQRNGGHLVAAPNQGWECTNDDKEDYGQLTSAGTANEAVYGFKDDAVATFDTFEMLIANDNGSNVAEFELLAGNDSALGTFQSLGTFRTQNVRLFPSGWQMYTFAPVHAKYLKVRIISTHSNSSYAQAFEWGLLGSL